MIEVNNLTEIKINENLVKKIARLVLDNEKKQGDISVAFIGPGRMRKLNKKCLNRNKTTDVLSFPENAACKEFFTEGRQKNGNLGEIIVCLRELKKNSKKFNVSFEKELKRIIIHGTLHLLGYEDEGGEEKRKEMKEKEEEYLKIFNHF